MRAAGAAHHDGVTAQVGGQPQRLAPFGIVRLRKHARQIVDDKANARVGNLECQRILGFAHGREKHFEAMGDAVDCAIGCERGRRIERDGVIVHRALRHNRHVHNQLLLPRGHVGDVGVLGELRARA